MSEHVIVNMSDGSLRGRKVTSKNGGSFFSFQGVPYAAPPVGDLRFKAPQPPKPWTGVLDALKEGNVSPQLDPIHNKYTGEEDCLFLNVYTPQLPGNDPGKAVMVYIHGGGYFNGSGNSEMYGADFLVEKGVVLVTFNYRLGALGFLCTEDNEIPGNAGMKDQVAVLRWVQKNIAQFGGDPNNVTIFGESAGGASVHFHLLSPMSKGLFHRAIAQSGSALNGWAYCTAGRSRAVNFAKALGCKSEDSKEIRAFLKDVPAKKLVDCYTLGVTPEEKRRGVSIPFSPIPEEGFSSNEEKFLTGHPIDIIKSGNINKADFIIGVTTKEGYLLLKEITKNPDLIPMIGKDIQKVLPVDMYPKLDTEKSLNAAQKIKNFYFGDKEVTKDSFLEYAELNSDSQFVYKVVQTAKLHATHSSSKVFFYQFAFDGKLNVYKRLINITHLPGVCHADDLGYIFSSPLIQEEIPVDSAEFKVRDTVVRMWTNFAKIGNPSADITWNPISRDKLCYLKIDESQDMRDDLEKKRVDFWDELYNEATSS